MPAQITSTKFSFNTDYLGKLTNFIRSFGDGNAGAGETATHTYNTPGTYTVRVQATTSTNTIVSDTVKVTV
ncbi:PKD domain-containing protein [Patescibacteria group bacterium]|nr:PKD domain-containing protein [Patescibacteria group bacterium]